MGKFKRIKNKCLSVITALVILLMPLTLPVNAVTTASEAVAADETAVTYSTVPTVHVLTHTFGGLSVLLEYNGHFGLIDSGEDKDSPATDSGYWHTGTTGTLSKASEDYSIPYFKSLGVTKDNFDFFIGTHPHSDHIGAADEIIREFRPKKVYLQEYSDSYIIDPGPEAESNPLWDNRYVYERTISAARAVGAELIQDINSSNASFYLGPENDTTMRIDIKNYGDDYKYKPTGDANDFSLGVLVTANGKQMFISGDINNFGGDEDKLAKELGDIDALVLGHHGHYGSNSYNYVTTLNPELMIIPGSFSSLVDRHLPFDKTLFETLWYMGTKTNPSKLFATSWLAEKGYNSLDVYLNSDGVTTNVPSGFEYFAETKFANNIWTGIYYVDGVPYYDSNNTFSKDNVSYTYYNDTYYMTGTWEGDSYDQSSATVYKFKSAIDNSYVTGWNLIYGKWYYFEENGDNKGEIVTGWREINGYWYYFDTSIGGALKTGRFTENGNDYYFALDGKMRTNYWYTDESGYRYFFDSNGNMVKNNIVGTNQYLDSNGVYQEPTWNGTNFIRNGAVLVDNWVMWKDGYYYVNNTGTYVTGWQTIPTGSTINYYFSESGRLGYYTGQMVTGIQKINGSLYYFSTGTELRPIISGSSQLTTEGCQILRAATDPWVQTADGKWYYLDADNTLHTGWGSDNGNIYYFDPNTGQMQIGLLNDNGTYYYMRGKSDVGSEGSKVTTPGVYTTGYGKSYYVTNENGVIYTSGTGRQEITHTDGKTYTYYLYDDYSLAKGATKIGDEIFYFVNDGEEDLFGQPVGSLVTTVGFIRPTDGNVYYVYGTGKDTSAGGNSYEVGRLFDERISPEKWLGWLNLNVDGKKEYYFFDDLAVMQTGFVETYNGEEYRTYYLAKSSGTIKVNSVTFNEGQMIYGGRFKPDDGSGNYYFANKDDVVGKLLTGVQQDNDGNYYYFINGDERSLPDGNAANSADKFKQVTAQGWITDASGNKYYVKADGTLAIGATKIDNIWYYFCAGSETEMPDGATTQVGALVTSVGWIEIADSNDAYGYTRYYVYNTDGRLFDDKIKATLKDPTKVWYGWLPLYDENDTLEFYRFNENAVMQKGFENSNTDNKYYLDPSGTITINGKTFKKGQMVYGGKFIVGDDYYYANGNNDNNLYGNLLTGVRTDVDGKNYYFQTGTEQQLPDGSTASTDNKYKQVTAKGWVLTERGNWYYIDGNGVCYPSSKGLTISNNVLENNTENSLNDKEKSVYNFKISRTDGEALTSRELECSSVQRSAKTVEKDGTFTLSAGESVTFTGLVSDKEYYVESLNTDKSWIISTKYSTDGTNYSDGTSVEITANESEMQNITFKNYIDVLEVTLNYYDRSVENGLPSDISSKPTTFTKTYVGAELYSGNTFNVSKLIVDTAVYADEKVGGIDNIVDKYGIWGTQTEASGGTDGTKGICAMTNHHTSTKEKYTKTKLADGKHYNTEYHTDQYGYTYDDSNYSADKENPEKWITYFGADGKEVDYENDENITAKDVYSVNVWLYNEPRDYTVTAYEANATNKPQQIGSSNLYVGTSPNVINNVYYNQRLGAGTGDSSIDDSDYLAKYGINGYAGEEKKLSTSYKIDIDDSSAYYFQYWSFDEKGKTVASTDIKYNYRITKDIELYAIYAKSEYSMGAPGLTVSQNNPDVFIDTNGISKTRLNTMMNPYNCPDYDDNITQASIVYVLFNQKDDLSNLNNIDSATGKTYLDILREGIKGILDKGDTSGKVTVIGVEKTASGFKYDVQPADGTGTEIKLTNKNRIQFSTTFTTSTLNGKRLLAFAGMNYNGANISENNWIVSDNYIDYNYLNS